MATHSSTFAWRIPCTEEPGGLWSMGLQRVGHARATNTIKVGDFNTSLSEMDRSSRQKISNDIVELKSTINQLDIIDIY